MRDQEGVSDRKKADERFKDRKEVAVSDRKVYSSKRQERDRDTKESYTGRGQNFINAEAGIREPDSLR